MSAAAASLSDKALAVFAFAAYHQLESGQPVTSVIRSDGAGHKADEEAVSELVGQQLIASDGNDLVFSQQGLNILARIIEGLRTAAA
jgi:chromosome segregation and condensation protein ScpB